MTAEGFSQDNSDKSKGRGVGSSPSDRPLRGSARGSGIGLRIYKPGQGYYTRVGTAVGAGVLILGGAMFVFEELGTVLDPHTSHFFPLQYGMTVGFLLLLSALVYWIVGLNRKANDFFIATEGEMKKVSWSTKREVIRSTKVVIVTVLLLGLFLFTADIAFMLFFSTIDVLKGAPGLESLLGIES